MQRALAGIKTGVEQQVRLIEDLLDATRVMSGKLRLTREPVVLRTALERTLNSVRFSLAHWRRLRSADALVGHGGAAHDRALWREDGAESAALAVPASHLQLPTVARQHVLHDGQAQPGAAGIA